jgi:ketosteroid isomerase-like protein
MPRANSPKSSTSGDTKVFSKLLHNVVRAWETQDPAKAAPFYSKKSGLLFFDFAPLKYSGWNEYAQGVQKVFFDNMPPNSNRVDMSEDVQVRRLGKGAVTATTFHFWAKMKDGTTIENDGRHTAVWEKEGKKWVITHDHWSFPFSPK